MPRISLLFLSFVKAFCIEILLKEARLPHIMANDDKISMPQSTAGLTRYFEDYETNITFQPGHVILIVVLVIAIVVLLHMYGDALLGLR